MLASCRSRQVFCKLVFLPTAFFLLQIVITNIFFYKMQSPFLQLDFLKTAFVNLVECQTWQHVVNCYSKQVLQSGLDFIFTCAKLFFYFWKLSVNLICLSVCYDLSKFRNFIHNQLLRHEKRKKAKARAWVRTATSLPTIQVMSSERAFSCG